MISGDLGDNYKMILGGKIVSEVTTPVKGTLNVGVEKDHNHQLILSAVVILGLISQ